MFGGRFRFFALRGALPRVTRPDRRDPSPETKPNMKPSVLLTIFFLATPLASYTTGTHIDVSGGNARHI